ncbi:hypothetical protein AAF712_002239 [Marasmius tenuissimus]|uniref:Uncharacterized protein n=1 Tax=Marasmius tenuissimus TaxID=585030 RepID=A0ABR3A9M9_9AGAR|nr:hypothetical protein PM082_020308 [Marasmius tenuissimus]
MQGQSLRPLSIRQERKLVDYLENEFIELTRAFKKRLEPTSNVGTLPEYLQATGVMLSMILQIPPFDPSTSLRTAFLLRLTNEVFASIPGYPPSLGALPDLADWLDDIDQAWVVVLRLQVWDRNEGVGVTVDLPAASDLKSSPMNQTERTRLKSLLVGGMEMLEDWIGAMKDGSESESDGRGQVADSENLTVPDAFNDLFSRTCSLLEIGEENPIPSTTEIEMTCDSSIHTQ